MPKNMLARIERRLQVVGISSTTACRLAGLKSTNLIRQMRRAAINGKGYDPRIGTLAALAPILMTTEEWLAHERGPEEVMPSKDTIRKIAAAKVKSRKSGRKLSIQNFGHDVTVVEKSAQTDLSQIRAQHVTAPIHIGAGEILSQINAAIVQTYREFGKQVSPEELGHVAAEHYASIVTATESPEELPHAIEIMRVRLRRLLSAARRTKEKPQRGKRK